VTLRARVLLSLAYVLLLSLVAFGVPLALSLRDRVDAEVRSQATSQADILASTASGLLSDKSNLQTLVGDGAANVRGRVLAVDRAGRVLADSGSAGTVGQNYAARPEIATALAGRNYQQTRHSDTLREDILATATPIRLNGGVAGALRVTQSVASVHRAVWKTTAGLALIALVVLVLGLGVGALIARQIARPVDRLDAAVRRISAGDLDARAPVEGSSEQRSLAESFNQMAERLSDALSSQRRFVADASHQLRTPLTGLRLRIEEAQAVGVSPAADAELDAGLREVDRLSQMVDELLVLSRAGERGSAAAEVIPLGAASDRALERWRAAAEEHGIELTRAPDRAPASVHVYPADLDRALDSLVENAINYSDPGGEVQLAVSGDTIEVLDRGRGLEPGEEDAVFERFHRGRAGRTGAAGTGLGLAIARELARRWGGDVALAQRPGGGTRATLTYPVLDTPTEGGNRHAAEPVT